MVRIHKGVAALGGLIGGAVALVMPCAWATTSPTDAATNFIVTRVSTAAFTADGINTGGVEYSSTDDMVSLGGSNFIEAKVFLKRYRDAATGDEQLRIYFSVHDIDAVPNDRIEFYFDRLHNHGTFASPLPLELQEDVQFSISRTNCSPTTTACNFTRRSRNALGDFTGTGTLVSVTNAVVQEFNVGEYIASPAPFNRGWTGEFVLVPADLGWGYFPQVVGFLVRATSANPNGINATSGTGGTTPSASYPSGTTSVVSQSDPVNWGNLKLRYPIDFGLVMDYSGNMTALDGLTQNRWVRAKRAADLFATTLGLFKDPFLADKVAVMQYSWSCSGSNTSGNTTGAVAGLSGALAPADIPAPPVGTASFTAGNSTTPPGNNCTPIQQGLEQALRNSPSDATPGMFGLVNANAKQDRILVLLSDGFHNMPPAHSSFDLNPGALFTATEKNSVHVRTVALGPDGSSGTMLLSEISTAFNGSLNFEAKYNNVLTFPDLLNAYLESVTEPMKINKVDETVSGFEPGTPDRLVFIAVWDEPTQAGAIIVQRDGTTVTPDATYTNTAIGYTAVVFDSPPSGGNWTLAPGGGVPAPNQKYALTDLRIFARYLVQQKPYSASDPILLQVRLTDMDKALTGAQATVEVAKPSEGLGNYLSTVQKDCSIGRPAVPGDKLVAIDPRRGTVVLRQASAPTGAVNPANADPLPGRYALAAHHFERCKKDGLARDNLPGLALYDDGSHGDPIADDGIYSLAFADTALEGSYTFRFHVRGSSSDGVAFTRTRTLSQFVGIQPTADATTTTTQTGPVIGGMQTVYLYFLPQDPLHNYLGPGFGAAFELSASAGQLLDSVQDLNNGYYVQAIRYPQGTKPPTITIEWPEVCFEKSVDLSKSEILLWWKWWMWLILIIIALSILLLWCLLRKV